MSQNGLTFSTLSQAFPITALELNMNRAGAMAAAAALRNASGGGSVSPASAVLFRPSGVNFSVAAAFRSSTAEQHFVELEGGGNDAFSSLIKNGTFKPFYWEIRHYLPADASESRFYFSPTGQTIGFYTKLPESEAPIGGNLNKSAAQTAAERAASAFGYPVNSKRFDLVEISSETRPGGRVDWDLAYEEQGQGVGLGKGRVRVVVVVGGTRILRIQPELKVPEAFERRYASMRSFNNTVAQYAWVAILVVYGGAALRIMFLLAKQRTMDTKPAARAAAAMGLLLGGAVVNGFPMAWMRYDTAGTVTAHQSALVVNAVIVTVTYFLIALFTLWVAEGVSRLQYPDHIQLWAHTTRSVAGSVRVFQDVAIGYLLVPAMFAYEVAFYFLNQEFFGWWTPSSPLVDPNVSASYAPFLTAVAMSLFAGFWEEALFRALPIAGSTYLLGIVPESRVEPREDQKDVKTQAKPQAGRPPRSRRAGVVFACTMIFQSLVFGAGHANYPAQPSYARVVELILPSMAFGMLYENRGLVPGVVLHFVYDLVWFSLPLFLTGQDSSPAGTTFLPTFQQAAVIICGLLPALVCIGARISSTTKESTSLKSYLNAAWRAPTVDENTNEKAPVDVRTPPAPRWVGRYGVLLVLPIALAVCFANGMARPDATTPLISRHRFPASVAVSAAETAVGAALQNGRALPGYGSRGGMSLEAAAARRGWDAHLATIGADLQAALQEVREFEVAAKSFSSRKDTMQQALEKYKADIGELWTAEGSLSVSGTLEAGDRSSAFSTEATRKLSASQDDIVAFRSRIERMKRRLERVAGAKHRVMELAASSQVRLALSEWTKLPFYKTSLNSKTYRFVSTEHKYALQWAIDNDFLPKPEYRVRFVRIAREPENDPDSDAQGPNNDGVDPRAEEWLVRFTTPSANPLVVHTLPEGLSGANLSRSSAETFLMSRLESTGQIGDGSGCSSPNIVSAVADRLPRRTDWKFEVACNAPERDDSMKTAESGFIFDPRIIARVTGDAHQPQLRLLQVSRYVKVPEEWLREETSRVEVLRICWVVSRGFIILLSLYSVIRAMMRWALMKTNESSTTASDRVQDSDGIFTNPGAETYKSDSEGLLADSMTMYFVRWFGAGFALSALTVLCQFPKIAFGIRTAEPLQNQILSMLAKFLMRAAFQGVVFGGFGVMLALHPFRKANDQRRAARDVRLLAASIGVLFHATLQWSGSQFPKVNSRLIKLGSAGTLIPLVHMVLSSLSSYLNKTFTAYVALEIASTGGLQSLTTYGASMVLGVACAGTIGLRNMFSLRHALVLVATSSLVAAVSHACVFRFHGQLVALAVAGFATIETLNQIFVALAHAESQSSTLRVGRYSTDRSGVFGMLGEEPYTSAIGGGIASICTVWMCAIKLSVWLKPRSGDA